MYIVDCAIWLCLKLHSVIHIYTVVVDACHTLTCPHGHGYMCICSLAKTVTIINYNYLLYVQNVLASKLIQ